MKKRIQPVSIELKDETAPFSPLFQDFYCSIREGIEESLYLYIEGSGFAESLAAHPERKRFTIGEIGFGVGLNFLLTYRHFIHHSHPSQKLVYFSVEKHPVMPQDLKAVYSQYPDLRELSDALLERYPLLVPGTHLLEFEQGRVQLILMLEDAADAYANLNLTPEQKIQYWYLDGFSPDKNPEAFDETLFRKLPFLSAPDAQASSFTSAGWVRRGLENAGFTVTKRAGFGTKRESILATLPKVETPLSVAPWFSSESLLQLNSGDRIGIIGAGLSGTALARSLADRGFSVILIDQESIAAHASGNPVGLFNVQLSKTPNPISRFSQLALAHFLRELKNYSLPVQKGILRADGIRENLQSCLETSEYPEDFYQIWTDGLYFPEIGILNPKRLCEERASHPNIRTVFSAVTSVERREKGFHLKNGEAVIECDHVVYATGAAQELRKTLAHPFLASLPLRPIRGQLIQVSPTEESKQLPWSIVDSGYVTPVAPHISGDFSHVVGATYQAKTILPDQERLDTETLLQEAKKKHAAFSTLEERHVLGHRAGFRLGTPDKLPLIGPVCDPDRLKQEYRSTLRSGKMRLLPPLPVEKGEWMLLGMGSRGITFSSYAAKLLTALMCGDPLPIEADLWEHLHSARFIVRNLKKPEAGNENLS